MTDSQLDHPTVGATVAERLERRPGAGPIKPVALRIVHEFDALDRAVYAAIAQTPTPTLDAALRRVSDAADHSKLWIGTAAGLAAAGGRRGRRSAMVGVGAVAITSASVNLLGKHLFRRARPDRAGQEVSQSRTGAHAVIVIVSVRTCGVSVRIRQRRRQRLAPSRTSVTGPGRRRWVLARYTRECTIPVMWSSDRSSVRP